MTPDQRRVVHQFEIANRNLVDSRYVRMGEPTPRGVVSGAALTHLLTGMGYDGTVWNILGT